MIDSIYIGCRIEKEIKNIIEQICKARGEDVSDFVRRSVRKELANLGYLSEEERKALGLA